MPSCDWRKNVCRSEEHTSELQSLTNLVCPLLLEKNAIKDSSQRVGGSSRRCKRGCVAIYSAMSWLGKLQEFEPGGDTFFKMKGHPPSFSIFPHTPLSG